MKVIIMLIFIGSLWSGTDKQYYPSFIVSFGNSSPAYDYDSYGSRGFTFKLSFESPVTNYENLRYNFGWQNIAFAETVISYDAWQNLQISEGEKANLFDVGLKFIINDGIMGNGLFRPYLNGSIGYGFFKQYTKYDGENIFYNECEDFLVFIFNLLTDSECETDIDYNINEVVTSRMSSSMFTLDLGASFSFNKSSKFAIEFGVRYLLVNSIKSSDWSNWQNVDGEESLNQLIGRKLNADYKSIYLGFSWYLMPQKKYKSDKPNSGGYEI